jgi:hypothetical protein
VLVVTLDTLRADRVGAYSYAAAAGPQSTGWPPAGRFKCHDPPLTLGTHEPVYGHVADNPACATTGFYVDEAVTTLAGCSRDAASAPAGSSARSCSTPGGASPRVRSYFDDFDLSEDVGPGTDAIQRRGADVVDQATAWLAEPATQPFFA